LVRFAKNATPKLFFDAHGLGSFEAALAHQQGHNMEKQGLFAITC
jgi:hypothetical protein